MLLRETLGVLGGVSAWFFEGPGQFWWHFGGSAESFFCDFVQKNQSRFRLRLGFGFLLVFGELWVPKFVDFGSQKPVKEQNRQLVKPLFSFSKA